MVDGANNNQALFSEGASPRHQRRLRVQHGFHAGIPGEHQQLQRGVGPGGGRRRERGHQIGRQRDPWRPVLLSALSHLERARSPSQIAGQLTPSQSINGSSSAAALAGPIVKDKLFYFGTYDGSRKVNPIAYTSSTYNASTRALAVPGAGDGLRSAPVPMRTSTACWGHSRAPPIRTWVSASWTACRRRATTCRLRSTS